MRVGVISPYRNDRPLFLEHLKKMVAGQTLQPVIWEIVDYEAESAAVDITQRYRRGYDKLRGKGLDVIALLEVDDWYAPNYLEVMVNEWVSRGKPDLLGQAYTIYYHIGLFAYFTMHHNERSSAMNTLIKPDLDFPWCPDHEPFTDLHLWKTLKGQVFKPEKHICLGTKHGTGLCGGKSHVDRLHRYTSTYKGTPDLDKSFLQSLMDEESFNFYSNYFNTQNHEKNCVA